MESTFLPISKRGAIVESTFLSISEGGDRGIDIPVDQRRGRHVALGILPIGGGVESGKSTFLSISEGEIDRAILPIILPPPSP